MAEYFTQAALLRGGWARDVRISVDEDGWITAAEDRADKAGAIELDGPVIPGMGNLHSHAFQRAMAGLAERSTGGKDSFWTWRETMYKFLGQITPEQQEAIAAQLYVEMLKAGYTCVGEFHYLHHQPAGDAYDDVAASSHHIIRAAKAAGIAITHLPVLYAYGGFNGQKPDVGQRRFINTPEQILDIIASLRTEYEGDQQIRVGLAHHSLRAVDPQLLEDVTKAVKAIDPAAPVHIHVAEQVKEVEDCIAWCGQRPVEWLLDNAPVDAHWCLIHATHMTEQETRDFARTGAVAGLCPTTEANLGDGLFNLGLFVDSGGDFGIGSDSHISVNMIEELRLLEYGQRLFTKERTVTREDGVSSNGATLFSKAIEGGRKALGIKSGTIEAGKRADFVVLDGNNPTLALKRDDYITDSMVFAVNSSPVKDVIAGGKWVVKDFRHEKEDEIFADYKNALKMLWDF